MNVNAEKNPITFFTAFDETIDDYLFQTFDIKPQLSEGQLLFIYFHNDKTVYRTELFSSMGKTIYTSYYESCSASWYIEKKAFFYNSPFDINNADKEISYYKYNGNVYKFDEENSLYIQDLDIDTAPAVVDFRTAESIIKLNREYMKTNERNDK